MSLFRLIFFVSRSVLVAALSVLLFGCDDGDKSTGCDNAACDMGRDDLGGMEANDSEAPTVDAEFVSDVALPGTANVDPSVFEFPFVAIGRQFQSTIRVRNTGQASVTLDRFASAFGSDYALFWTLSTAELPLDEQNAGVIGGMNQMPDSIELEAGSTLQLTLLYSPSEMGQRGGHFLFWADTEIRLPIEHSDERPRLEPDINSVDFENADVGERVVKLLRITNVGTAIATLDAVQLQGDDVFSITIDRRDPCRRQPSSVQSRP